MGKYLVAIGVVWVIFSLIIGFIVISSPPTPAKQVSRSQVNYAPVVKSAPPEPRTMTKTKVSITEPDVAEIRLKVVR